MNMKYFGASAVTAMMLAAAPALALTVFDDFTVDQGPVEDDPGAFPNSDSMGFGAGQRILEVENLASVGNSTSATRLEIAAGSLRFSNLDGATGKGTVTYTNVGDIQQGPSGFFLFDVGVFDNDAQATFTVTATDNSANVSTFEEVLAAGFDPKLRFSEFTGSADFDDLDTLSFMIDSQNVAGFGPTPRLDGSLNSISIGAVPLPAGGLLLLSAFGGAAVLRRRKDRKAA